MEIKDYKEGDETKILELFELSFKRSMSIEYWKWRFLDNPIKKIMIKLMWDKDKLVGHYAVSPVMLNNEQDKILTALSMTTMTHPSYNGKGVFTELAETLYCDEEKKSNLKAVWGFPNTNSHYGFVKNLKWLNLERIPTLTLDCSILKFIDFSGIIIVDKFTVEHIETQKKNDSMFKIKVNKSLEYLNWRYIQSPLNKYDVFEGMFNGETNFAVTKVFSSFQDKNRFEVDILEISFPANYELLLKLMNAIKDYYKSFNIWKINLWLPLIDEKHILFEKIGFTNTLPITYSGIRVLDQNIKSLELAASWCYSMGDSDVY